MFVTYTPEDTGDAQTWEFRPGRVRASRAAMLEKRYAKLAGEAKTWDQFKADVVRGSADARRVLLWHLQSLDHPTLRIDDVDPLEDELLVEHSRSELEELRAELVKAKGMDDEQRQMILGKLDDEIETARDDDRGKAPSTDSEPATS